MAPDEDLDVPRPTAVASAADGRILAVGSLTEVAAVWRGPHTVIHEFGEEDVIIPGFVEPHMHPLFYGLLSEGVDCGPDACDGSHKTMLARLGAAARALPRGAVVRGWNYEYSALDAGRPVTRQELDAACGLDRKVAIDDASLHVMFVSTQVLQPVCASMPGLRLHSSSSHGVSTGVLCTYRRASSRAGRRS